MKYSSDEARNLKAYGELPENGNVRQQINFCYRLWQSANACVIHVCTMYVYCLLFPLFYIMLRLNPVVLSFAGFHYFTNLLISVSARS